MGLGAYKSHLLEYKLNFRLLINFITLHLTSVISHGSRSVYCCPRRCGHARPTPRSRSQTRSPAVSSKIGDPRIELADLNFGIVFESRACAQSLGSLANSIHVGSSNTPRESGTVHLQMVETAIAILEDDIHLNAGLWKTPSRDKV